MKIDIKCYEFLTNKGNGKKCKLAPLINCRHQDCPFKTNGMIQSSTSKVKIRYIYSLTKRCKEWHENKKDIKHFYEVIEPQIEKICSDIECKQQTKC